MNIIAEVEAICRKAEREIGPNWTVADLSNEDKEFLKEASQAEFQEARQTVAYEQLCEEEDFFFATQSK